MPMYLYVVVGNNSVINWSAVAGSLPSRQFVLRNHTGPQNRTLNSGHHLMSHKKFSLGYSLRTAIAKVENYPLEKTLKR
jgi:hypothetical protein